jgi:hypothetical protein
LSPKPHRFLLERASSYADEAGAYVRRRRTSRKPFARVYRRGDRSASYAAGTEPGRALFLAASKLIDAAAR